ncbi:uncharacterized protein PV09_02934 [Verruconis gallopava]|uniref:Anaphase-promoting complex subunit 4 WD40 domain-containing protein n=1 Tax=Verruconis gallopava TaxID=253628 RepID=A0A0D2B5N1_9PEZI|nr:uncharacterized protein PV09_02934 [Verruconis gallopava]KIW06499.1 hypothetical protein PV09_02934 [Verruconis gallopava]
MSFASADELFWTSPRASRRVSADRFIPSSTSPHSLILGRHPERLSPREKIQRTISAGPDPFNANVPRTPIRHRAGSSPSSAGHSIGSGNAHRGAQILPNSRRFGQATVWAINDSWTEAGNSVSGVPNGRGRLLASGTNAPLFSSNFLSRKDSIAELDVHERRLAVALDLDTASRVLKYSTPRSSPESTRSSNSPPNMASLGSQPRTWRDGQWESSTATCIIIREIHVLSLAVGLGSHVYLWTESRTVGTPESLRTSQTAHVTSLSFSSPSGGRAILAVGRADGGILLWSPAEDEARWNAVQPNPICCVSFRPHPAKRPSIRDPYIEVETEELLVGDEAGHLFYYSVEWPTEHEKELWGWQGAMTLLLRITAHTQQICGIAWSSDCEFFATGGNDNCCYLFETRKVLQRTSPTSDPRTSAETKERLYHSHGASTHVPLSSNPCFMLSSVIARHKFTLLAAVKAIAFCPWQKGLLAVGGGSNDRCIHFYHTLSGSCLGKIDCCAQVTSLVWSITRREIAATFGFAQPEHPFRIAVFAWPSCKQIVAIPWYDEHRALYAIPYPGGPDFGLERSKRWSRTGKEGCLVVATSDCSIKFHEVWAEERKGSVVGRGGVLGGSDILESLHGIDKEGVEVIR